MIAKHYRIMGNFQDQTEELDWSSNEEEAIRYKTEFQLSLGSTWHVWVEEQLYIDGHLDSCYPLEKVLPIPQKTGRWNKVVLQHTEKK